MRSIIIGVAGGTGSGKTTVANRILEQVGAEHITYIPHDAYYKDLRHLTFAERSRTNFDHPDALETRLMIEHLKMLRDGQAVEIPVYDFTQHVRADETIHVEPSPIIMVEGILIFAEPALRSLFDVKLFIDTDADIRLIRRLQRDMQERGRTFESVITQYMTTVRPMHLEFVEPSKRYADVIIPEGGFNEVAIEMVAARIRGLLGEHTS
ncbi:MAG TPA: uridine kinase [Anaerolineae bacterium]|nr:uridine kinase [Anaerolineae bacterium]HQH37353.1 uridine kinase [Anaerolineae bacterium]